MLVCDRRPEMEFFPDELPWLSKPAVMREAAAADRRQRAACARPARLPRLRGGRRRAVLARAALAAGLLAHEGEPPAAPDVPCAAGQRDACDPPSDRRAGAGSRRGRSSSCSRTSSSRSTTRPGPRCSRCRGTSCPSSIQDPVWEQSFPPVGSVVVPVLDPASGRMKLLRLSRREAAPTAAAATRSGSRRCSIASRPTASSRSDSRRPTPTRSSARSCPGRSSGCTAWGCG